LGSPALPLLCSDWRSALTATGTLRKNVILLWDFEC
jgi:hypothetical protein